MISNLLRYLFFCVKFIWKKNQELCFYFIGNENVYIFSDANTDELPERELYIRWLQLMTFLPVRRYSYLPSQYDKEVIDLAKNLTLLRQQKVSKN